MERMFFFKFTARTHDLVAAAEAAGLKSAPTRSTCQRFSPQGCAFSLSARRRRGYPLAWSKPHLPVPSAWTFCISRGAARSSRRARRRGPRRSRRRRCSISALWQAESTPARAGAALRQGRAASRCRRRPSRWRQPAGKQGRCPRSPSTGSGGTRRGGRLPRAAAQDSAAPRPRPSRAATSSAQRARHSARRPRGHSASRCAG